MFKRRSLPSVVVVASVVVRRCLSSYVVVSRHVRPSSSAAVRRRSLSLVVFPRSSFSVFVKKPNEICGPQRVVVIAVVVHIVNDISRSDYVMHLSRTPPPYGSRTEAVRKPHESRTKAV